MEKKKRLAHGHNAGRAGPAGGRGAPIKPGETGVVVSHGAAVRVATAAMLGWADDQFHSLRGLDNCGWAVLEDHPVVPGLKLSAYNRAVTG